MVSSSGFLPGISVRPRLLIISGAYRSFLLRQTCVCDATLDHHHNFKFYTSSFRSMNSNDSMTGNSNTTAFLIKGAFIGRLLYLKHQQFSIPNVKSSSVQLAGASCFMRFRWVWCLAAGLQFHPQQLLCSLTKASDI